MQQDVMGETVSHAH